MLFPAGSQSSRIAFGRRVRRLHVEFSLSAQVKTVTWLRLR